MKFLTLLLFIFAGISNVFAQQAVDEESFATALKILREKTSVPPKMPTFFISPAYFTAKQKRNPLKAKVTLAETDGFELELCLSESCRGDEYYGVVAGEKVTPTTERLKFDQTIRLAGGVTGFYEKATCGASCGNDQIFWQQNGYRYAISMNFGDGDLPLLTKFADSAIENAGLEIPGKTANLENQRIDAFLKTLMQPEDTLEFEAKGDLNADSLSDWTGIIQRKKSPPFVENDIETDRTLQLYVLFRQPDGSYKLSEKSKETGVFGAGKPYVEALEIERGSILLQLNSTAYASFSQFRFYNNVWRLVGWREVRVDNQADTMFEKDRNLLTGAVIEKRQKGEQKPTFKRYRKTFPRLLLSNFNLFGWNEIE